LIEQTVLPPEQFVSLIIEWPS